MKFAHSYPYMACRIADPGTGSLSSSQGFFFTPLFEVGMEASIEGTVGLVTASLGANIGTSVGVCQWCPQGTHQAQNDFNCAGR